MKTIACAAAALVLSGPAHAQMAHQFELIGHIESLTADDPTDPLSPGRITVHGVEAVLPRNLIIQMPARYLTVADIANLNPGTPGLSGLALDETPAPLAAYEATVVGNIVGDRYIAGLVWIAQHSLATGAGFIQEITPEGEIHLVADPDAATPPQRVTRLRINNPNGVFAPPDPLADPRFMVDEANPTIHAGTGYPMCIPQAGLEAECPAANRPEVAGAPLTTFVMGTEVITGSPAGAPDIQPCPVTAPCDPTKQAPLMPGDFITYAGTLAADGAETYISAHTIDANVGIYTDPGSDPAYVVIEGSLIDTQGPLVPRDPATPGFTLPQETQDRLKIEGVTTDPRRSVELYAIDVDPASGDATLRLFNTVPAQPAPLGRFRLILGSRANALFNADGDEIGAPREILARVATTPNLDGAILPDGPTFAHGLVAGQYVAPVGEFIFPENNLIGDPILPDNFECLPFLALGSGPLTTTVETGGPLVGPLDPWPDVVPAPVAASCGVRPKPV